MEEIWWRLDKVYGDTQLSILIIKANLENLLPKATENYKRVLEVFEAVETAVTQLNNLEALHYVKDDFALISKLVMKLPEEYQYQYTEYITSDNVNRGHHLHEVGQVLVVHGEAAQKICPGQLDEHPCLGGL